MQEEHNELSDNAMPLIEHLRELRKRFMISVLAFIAAFIVCFIFSHQIFQFLIAPLVKVYGNNIQTTSLPEKFITYIRLSLYSGLIVSFPVIAVQIYMFLAPGLYKNEKKLIRPFLIAAPSLFIMGAALCYYMILPVAWKFFLTFGEDSIGNMQVVLNQKASDYLSLVTGLIMAFGLAFQLPLVIILLCHAGLVTTEALKKKRKYAIVIIVTIAGIITPPDVISQIGLAVPMQLLYEISIIICKAIEKNREKKNA